jgi:hypothetical protein
MITSLVWCVKTHRAERKLTNIMKALLFIAACLLSGASAIGQASFSNAEVELSKKTGETGTTLFCEGPAFSFTFRLKTKSVDILNNGGFVIIDSQAIQITPLKPENSKKRLDSLSVSEQKDFLAAYSKYELDYFTKELGIEVINPNNQWVDAGSRKWYIWYFRVGKVPGQVEKKMEIQLLSSTILGNHVLTLNAPILADGDFRRAALIVNEMMETLSVTTK